MISNELDFSPYAARLRSTRRVQIPGFLQEDAAEKIHRCLREQVPWETAQRADLQATAGQKKAALPGSPEDEELLLAASARKGFEFYFDRYRMLEARRSGSDPELLLHVVLDFLNCPQFLEFARGLTGDPAIRMVSAMAVRYRPGHFLRLHNDRVGDEDRAFAYVINLSRDWQSDWGGLLQFVDEEEPCRVVETFTPLWNSLSLFKVPQLHQVSLVAPWAEDARYTIAGWFRRS